MKAAVPATFVAAGVALALIACGSPNRPSASFISPALSGPANGTVSNSNEPVTLTITNAVRTGNQAATYTFEVATDANFASIAARKDDVPEGPNGTTSAQFTGLSPNNTYYWHARARIDGADGQFSDPQTFRVAPPIVFSAPGISSPAANANAYGNRPSFVIVNASRTGQDGATSYEFQVASDSGFTKIIAQGTVQQGSGVTSYTPNVDLPEGALFWRARAVDPNFGVTGPYSDVVPFTRRQGLDLRDATLWDSPIDFRNFAVTTQITALDLRPDGIVIDFTKRNGPGRWPDIIPKNFDGPIQFSLGMAMFINGQWHAAAPIEFWNDREVGGGPPSEYRLNWFYEPARWGVLSGHQPSPGETIGFFVVAGDMRGFNSTQSVPERSDVVLVPMPTDAGASYRF